MSVFSMLLTATKSGPTPPVLNHDIQGYSSSKNAGFYINLNGPGGISTMINTDSTGYWYYDIPSGVTLTSLYHMFSNVDHLTSIYFNNTIDTSNVTVTSDMFINCSGLQTISGIENLDLSSSTTMASMFSGCSSLTTISNLSIDLNSCTTINGMFEGCSSLTTIDLSVLINSEISCMDMRNLFKNCTSLTSVNFGSFKTDYATTFNGMFEGCSSLTTINLSTLNTERVEDFGDLFKDCISLGYVNLGTYNGGIDTNNVRFFSGMFDGCLSLTTISIDTTTWAMTKAMSTGRMFKNCQLLQSIPYGMFSGTGSNYRNSSYMFYGCSSLQFLNTNIDTKYVTDMSHMFEGCTRLTSNNIWGSFDTSSCKDMSYMFKDCTSIPAWFGVLQYDTSLVENISYMFDGCTQLRQLGLASWNLSSVDVTDQTKYAGFVPNISTLTVNYANGIPSEIRSEFPNVNWVQVQA